MKITEITRSFSKTLQEKQFEPINIFASYKGELDGTETPEEIEKFSEELFQLAKATVQKHQTAFENPKKYIKEVINQDPF